MVHAIFVDSFPFSLKWKFSLELDFACLSLCSLKESCQRIRGEKQILLCAFFSNQMMTATTYQLICKRNIYLNVETLCSVRVTTDRNTFLCSFSETNRFMHFSLATVALLWDKSVSMCNFYRILCLSNVLSGNSLLRATPTFITLPLPAIIDNCFKILFVM